MKILRGGSENLYTSKPTPDIIIQIGWFSTQQLNDLCNSAISAISGGSEIFSTTKEGAPKKLNR